MWAAVTTLGAQPAGWTDQDIGSPFMQGSVYYALGHWTVSGGGSDIWDPPDQFNFVFETTTNNQISAQVASVESTDPWAKAGVMFRNSEDPFDVFAAVEVTAANGVSFQWRNSYAGGGTASTVSADGEGNLIIAPLWVQLMEENGQFSAAYSYDGNAWNPIGGPAPIPMGAARLAGLCVTAHNDALLNTSTFNNVSVVYAQPTPPTSFTFGVYRELWDNLDPTAGDTLDMLTNTVYNPNWPTSPDPAFTTVYTNFEAASNTGMDYYGQRMRAFVVPPVSGDYAFWVSSDDTSELFVSSDETEADKALVCWVSSWTNPEQWSNEPNQESSPVFLEAGRRYYMEALMQQQGGGDNLAVRWRLPDGTYEEPLPSRSALGTRLIPCTGIDSPPGIYQASSNLTIVEGGSAFFSVLSTNQSSMGYQWFINGQTIGGATSPSLSISNVSLANSGDFYSCTTFNSLGTTSTVMVLTVLPDKVPPAVASVINVGATNVQIVFSKTLAVNSAINPTNYRFTNGLPVSRAVLGTDLRTVTLATGPLVYGSNYTILVSGVRDRAATPNTIQTNTPADFVALPLATRDVGNPTPASVTVFLTNGCNVTASGSDIGGGSDQFSLNYQPQAGDFDLAVRIAGIAGTEVWAKAGLMAREGLDPGSRFAAALTTPTMAGSFFEWRDPALSQASTLGAFPPNFPDSWLRLKRANSTNFTGFASWDGITWTPLGSATLAGVPAQMYVGLAFSSHNTNLTSSTQFRDLTVVTNAVVGTVANPHEPLGPCSRLTPIVISEIMYKPAARADTNNLEFVEIYNSNPFFEDIGGFQLVSGSMQYTIPRGTTLNGGAFLVVAASPQSFLNVYGLTNVAGPYTGSLKKADTLRLLDDQGVALLTVPYSDTYPWPVAAHDTGHSLVLANPTYGEADPRAWDISDTVGGSPGARESFHPTPLRNVVINELLAHSEDPNVLQFIELYNHSSQATDVSGCILTDDPTTNKFAFPPGSVIPPGGYLSADQSELGFVLNGSGGVVYFIQPGGCRVLDTMSFEAQADGVSFGRWPDGASELYPLAARTPGLANSPIRVGNIVINELMYDPISGNDDDQYIELYNQGSSTVALDNWQLVSGVTFTFPVGTSLAADGYLVVGRNLTNLFAKYSNLNPGNTVGNYAGKLSHKGERVALAKPEVLSVAGASGMETNTIYVVQDEVTYAAGGRWGQWAHGGGSSLELINPGTNHRLAYNWGDSDETAKSTWTNLEFTGVLDNGASYDGLIDLVQVGLLDVGECLVDNLEVDSGGSSGPNIVFNGDFEAGLNGWSPQGDHMRSSLETPAGLGGYLSGQSLHLRSDDTMWTLGDYVQGSLTDTTLSYGQVATLRLKARWLKGWPEILMRLRGNYLEVTGRMPVPSNLGTPGKRNSRYVSNPGPAIFEVKHAPALPATNTLVVVTARFHDTGIFQPTLLYRIDTGANPAPTYNAVPMVDDGSGGDALAGDGVYSATIPPLPTNAVIAFLVQATNASGAGTLFPADLHNNAGIPRECVVSIGDPIPTASFSHHHVFITQNWATLWAQWGGVSHESYDGTWVDGGGRIIYNWRGRYAGSPYHQYLGSPVTTVGGMHWDMPEDDQVFGTASFDKQHVPGNGALDDNTIQREQTSYWMAHRIGLQRQNRRYYFYYVNGTRHGPLMEDTQVPGADMIKEYWPNDSNGVLYKNHSWFEGDVAEQPGGYMNFANESWCVLSPPFTTTLNGLPNQYKLASYRWIWLIRQYPDSANNYGDVFALMDAANTPQTSPDYYSNMEALVDTEEWLRLSAMEHATGDWDSFFTQNQWNMYNYKPTMGKWTALKWDWNITLGSGTQTWPPDGSDLFNYGAYDPGMVAFHTYPPYRRAYLRALEDIANLAMNNTYVDPVLDAKYAAFVDNGLTAGSGYGLVVQEPGTAGLKQWIGQMHNSLLAALTNAGVSAVPFTVSSVEVSNNAAILSGTAPLEVKTLSINGAEWPVLWPSVTGWTVTVPLQSGTNQFSVVGVDLHGQQVAGASTDATAVLSGPAPSPFGHIVINEIMYAPTLPDANYLELYNNSSLDTFDLSGWQIPALSYTFPAGSLMAPGSFLVLGSNPSAFAAAYGGSIPLFDSFTGALRAEEGPILLVSPGTSTAMTGVVAGVSFSNSGPWPSTANGTGSSLQLIDPRQDNWRPGNWAAPFPPSSRTPGTPNSVQVTLPAFPSLWLNEVQPQNLTGITNRAGQHTPWLELFNPTTNIVSLSGLYLANSYTNLAAWAFPANATVQPGSFAVIFADGQTNLSTSHELHANFTLTPTTGSLALSRLDNEVPQVLDSIDYTNLSPDSSYGSLPDGQSFARQAFYVPTPGATNAATVPISFIAYTAAGSTYFQNFDSLPNPGATSVDSANPVAIDGITYALANPFDFAAPVQSAVGGGLGLPAMAGWFGLADPTAKIGTRFGAGSGDQTAGGQISFGPPNGSNRALGLLATSTTGFTAFGARFINQSAQPLDHLDIQFIGELWRQSDKAKTLACYYFVDATATQPFSTNATGFLTNLDVAFPTSASATGGIAVDGATAPNQASLAAMNQPIATWPPGAALWLVWEMTDPTGKAQGLAIDNLSFTAWPGSHGATPTLAPLANQTLILGETLSFIASATDSAQPPPQLIFSLAPGSPSGSAINPATGQFTWTPAAATTNSIGVIVSINGTPSLSATQTFTVTVLLPAPPPQLGVLGQAGHTLKLTWNSVLGRQYRLEYKGDLTDGNWTAVVPDYPGTGGPLTVNLGTGANQARFYRVALLQ